MKIKPVILLIKATTISCFRIAFCILASMMCSTSLYDIDFNLAKDQNVAEFTSDRSWSMSGTSNFFNHELFRRFVSIKRSRIDRDVNEYC